MKGPDIQPPRPNSCTYWVTDNLMAGEYPADRRSSDLTRIKLGQYLDAGITHFIDLTHEGEKPNYVEMLREEAAKRSNNDGDRIKYVRLPIQDFGIPNKRRMKQILDTIDDAVSQRTDRQNKVYVHCRGGIGRTGTTVGCYLVRHGNTGSEALDEVNRLFRSSDRSMESYASPETREQMDFVRNWEE